MNPLDNRPYFFDAGIRFQCQRCGACCTGDPGVVRVSETEIAGMAAHLALPVSRVIETFLYPFEGGYSIREERDGRCLFFADGCRIYPVRPLQCRTFPFWFSNLRSETRWRQISRACPGIGRGRLFPKSEILDILQQAT